MKVIQDEVWSFVLIYVLTRERGLEEEGNNRSSEADREVCVYTRSNTNRRCRLDKEIKGKGATQINQD